MDFPNPSNAAGNLVDTIKDKLNFGGRGSKRDAYRDDYDLDGFDYDEYADYGEYGYDEAYADDYEYTTRETYRSSSPHLVSSRDIRRTTSAYGVDVPSVSRSTGASVPGYLSSSADSRFSSRSTNRVMETMDDSTTSMSSVGFDRPETGYSDFVSPYQRHSESVATSLPSTGSTGLDGLFAPTDGSAAAPSTESSSSFGNRFSRKVEIFQPSNFEEAAEIVTMLKQGSVVILNLKYVNAGLSKRILDFSFGVVAALEATITYEAPQVFSITQSGKLTLVEKDQLRLQRII